MGVVTTLARQLEATRQTREGASLRVLRGERQRSVEWRIESRVDSLPVNGHQKLTHFGHEKSTHPDSAKWVASRRKRADLL